MLAALSRVTILLAAWMRRRHEEVASLNMCVFSDVVVVSTVSCRCLWCCIVARWKKGQGFLASGLEKNEGGSCYFIFWLPKTKTNFCVHQSLANTPNPSKQQNPIDVCSNELLVDLEYFSTFLCCCVVHGYILSLWVISKWWFLDCSSNIKSVHKWIKYQIFPPPCTLNPSVLVLTTFPRSLWSILKFCFIVEISNVCLGNWSSGKLNWLACWLLWKSIHFTSTNHNAPLILYQLHHQVNHTIFHSVTHSRWSMVTSRSSR